MQREEIYAVGVQDRMRAAGTQYIRQNAVVFAPYPAAAKKGAVFRVGETVYVRKHRLRYYRLHPVDHCVVAEEFHKPYSAAQSAVRGKHRRPGHITAAAQHGERAEIALVRIALTRTHKTTSGRFFHTLREIKETTVTEAEKPLEEAKKDA